MKVDDKAMVSIDYILRLDSGEEVERTPDGAPLNFIFGNGRIIPGLEQGLSGLERGAVKTVVVDSENAYGSRQQDLIMDIPLKMFPADAPVEPGAVFEADGPGAPRRFKIMAVGHENATVDFNHPLAGERLHFEVTITDVRQATAEELAEAAQNHGCGCGDDRPSCGSGGCSCG